jgi:hypothetical protein
MNRHLLKTLLPVFVVVAGGLGAVATVAQSDAAVNPPVFTQPVEREQPGTPAAPAPAPHGDPVQEPHSAPSGNPPPGPAGSVPADPPADPPRPPKPTPTTTQKPDGECVHCV